MIPQVIAQTEAAVPVHNHIGRDTVDPEPIAERRPPLAIEPEVLAPDPGYHGLVGNQRRSLVGNIYPHQIVIGKLCRLERLDGCNRCPAGPAPRIPEIDQNHLAPIGRHNGLEKFGKRHLGRRLDHGLAFDLGQSLLHTLLHCLKRLGIEGILHLTEPGEIFCGQLVVLRLAG